MIPLFPTLRRYSTARSGLKKAALIARSISGLGNPILSMLATAASRCDPSVRADGSLKVPPSVVVPVDPAGAGVGVAGTSCAEVFKAGAGAAGGVGVCAFTGTGVAGALEEEEALDALAGAALGCRTLARSHSRVVPTEPTLEIMQTMKPFSSM